MSLFFFDFFLFFSFIISGGNSKKNDGTNRTIQGFSDNNGKLVGEKWYDIYTGYWDGDLKYADTFTTNACLGQVDFASRDSPEITFISQELGCKKGPRYMHFFMYVIHELEAAIKDCKANVIGTHWDEAVAFYSGSIIIPDSVNEVGVLLYHASEKRCKEFRTCTASTANQAFYISAVTEKVFSLFAAGRDMQSTFQCDSMEITKEALVKQFAVPAIQRVIKHLYEAVIKDDEKSKAELWASASSILPMVNHYSPSVAVILRSNSFILNTKAVPSGYLSVLASLQSVYPAMGISCLQVGGLVDKNFGTKFIEGMEPCRDSSNNRPPAPFILVGTSVEIALVVVVVVFFVFLVFLAFYCYRQRLLLCCKGTKDVVLLEHDHYKEPARV
jgi:hypothetical protein